MRGLVVFRSAGSPVPSSDEGRPAFQDLHHFRLLDLQDRKLVIQAAIEPPKLVEILFHENLVFDQLEQQFVGAGYSPLAAEGRGTRLQWSAGWKEVIWLRRYRQSLLEVEFIDRLAGHLPVGISQPGKARSQELLPQA